MSIQRSNIIPTNSIQLHWKDQGLFWRPSGSDNLTGSNFYKKNPNFSIDFSNFYYEFTKFSMEFPSFSMTPCYRVDLRPKRKSLLDSRPQYSSFSILIDGNVMNNQIVQWTFSCFTMRFKKMLDLVSKFFNAIFKFFNGIKLHAARFEANFSPGSDDLT